MPRPASRRRRVAVVLAVVVDVAVALVAWMWLRPDTVSVQSHVVLDAPAFRNDEGSCGGLDAFTDVGRGARVTVTAGTSPLGSGSLSKGRLLGTSECVFFYMVLGVPRGKGAYVVTVAGHCGLQVREDAIADPNAMVVRLCLAAPSRPRGR